MNFTCAFGDFPYRRENVLSDRKLSFLVLQGREITPILYQGVGELLCKQSGGAHSRKSSKIVNSEYIEGKFMFMQVI